MVHSRTFLLGTTVLFCFLRLLAAYPQVETPMTAEDSQQSDSPQLSLSDLDALIEEDSEDEDMVAAIGDQVLDVLVLSAFLALALVSFFKKSTLLKYTTMIVSVVYIGFFKSSLVSIVNIFGLLEWNFPLFRYNLSWYLLMLFTVASTVLWGRLYCGRICSFGALTQLLDRVIPARLRFELPMRIERRAIYIKYLLLGAAIAYFLITRDNLIYRYIEPFWMFTLRGSTVMWVMLGLLLLTTVFIRNFYCRYLCPLGAALGLISNLTVFRIKRWSECKTCKICEKACEWGAIDGPRILVTECVRCDDCERLYRDEKKCPHWLVLKKASAKRGTPTLVQIKSQSA
ncbi:MAG: 4Fe-4S binding protein [Acidobacteria bacterium]|nr:4Fe-4S binding protein [Acidobacteriota bacterium]